MFEGKKYVQAGGYKGWATRFDEKTKAPGVCTTSYSYGMTPTERFEMARRITAALNLTTNLTTEQMENAVALRARPADAGVSV